MEYNKIKVINSINKDTIYTYLKRMGYSENYVKNLRKQEGYILLNGKFAHTDSKINDDDILMLCKNPNTKTSVMQCIIPLNIVYEDDDIIVVNKPSGLATSASRSHYTENLTGALLHYMEDKDPNFVVRIINRLDKDTAGLVIVAKHSLIANLLNENNFTKKTYCAILTGYIPDYVVVNKNIETTINEQGYNNHKREISPNGKPAITHIYPIDFDGKNTLCKVNIEFGRTHQIRVHSASINHPLLGDELYGTKSELISHTSLVCFKLTLYHPIKKETIELSVPPPEDFKNAFKKPITL